MGNNELQNNMSFSSFANSIYIAAVLIAASFLTTSCNKTSLKDDADDFVGTYNASIIENVRWGNDTGTLTPKGSFIITKVSAKRVKVSGYISTFGEVNGKTVYFESITNTDSAGTTTTVFQQGILNGNVLTFSSTSTGQLKYNGIMYPYSATSSWTAVKN